MNADAKQRLGATIRRLRIARNLTQKDLAAAIGLKQSASVSGWEAGTKGTISHENLSRLARFFGWSADGLLLEAGIDPVTGDAIDEAPQNGSRAMTPDPKQYAVDAIASYVTVKLVPLMTDDARTRGILRDVKQAINGMAMTWEATRGPTNHPGATASGAQEKRPGKRIAG